MSYSSFGVTFDYTSKNNLKMGTCFREDIFMTPYYGELLVIHENKQVLQFAEIYALKSPEIIANKLNSEHFLRETKAFLTFVSQGIQLYPFLRNYPQAGDSPDITEAKKMFIIFGVFGFAGNFKQCSESEQIQLLALPGCQEIFSHANHIASKENIEKNSVL